MQPNKTLINALRSVADKIEMDPYLWSWGEFEYCNCGLLAQELGLEQDSIENVFYIEDVYFNSWSDFGKKYEFAIEDCECKSTGFAIQNIVDTLSKNGVETKDLENLESQHIDREENIQGEQVLARNFREIADNLEEKLNS